MNKYEKALNYLSRLWEVETDITDINPHPLEWVKTESIVENKVRIADPSQVAVLRELVQITKGKYNMLSKVMELEEKLKKYEVIEIEIGIPLEVLFKALKEGFWFKDSGRVFFAKHAGVFNGVSGIYWFSGIDKMVRVKDYGKTWWLDKPKEELGNDKD